MKLKACVVKEMIISKKDITINNNTVTFRVDSIVQEGLKQDNFRLKVEVLNLDDKEIWCSFKGATTRHLMSGLKEIPNERGLVRESVCGEFIIGENETVDIGHKKQNCPDCENRKRVKK